MQPQQSDVDLYRSALSDVDALAQQDLVTAYGQVDTDNATETRDALIAALAPVVVTYHLIASTVAADWYDVMRDAAGVKGRFSAVMPDAPTPGRAESLVGWAINPLFGADPAPEVALTKLSGGLQRTVADGARQTVVESAQADPQRVGWVRVGRGNCDWCRRYLDGEVHYARGSDFDAHDHCRCTAVMHWG